MMLSFINTVMSTLCATMVFNITPQEETVISRRPHGTCLWCCAINHERSDPFRILAYTGRGPDGVLVPLNSPVEALLQAGVDPNVQTKIYLHGFAERAPSFSSIAVKDAYLSEGDYNILLIDWSHLSAAPWYVAAVKNTRIVGNLLADFLLRVDSVGLIPLEGVHVIGFSLGAEAAGFAGKAMPRDRRIPRITGLDPAFPLYYGGRQFHLSSGDAQFVDVIHTDAGILGYPTPIGDVDFYPNGGRTFQPGCLGQDVLTRLVSCSHLRAWRYYVESIKDPYGFPATKCERWKGVLPPCRFTVDNYMGLMATPKNKGKFYLETNPEPPYAKDAPLERKPNKYTLF